MAKNRVLASQWSKLAMRQYGGGSAIAGQTLAQQKVDIGSREIVGYGVNGEVTYIDSVMAPFPAIRFKEDKGEIAALRTKEQGDWKKLTTEEKKALYRASFCQTLAEVEAPTGEGKSIIGCVLVAVSIGIWLYLGMVFFVYGDLPDSFSEERMKAQIDLWLRLEMV